MVLILAAAVAAGAFAGDGVNRVELPCPAYIQTRQQLASVPEGWGAGPSQLAVVDGLLRHNGGASGFSTGPGQNSVFLVPDAQGWVIQPGEPTWFNCRYNETSILLSQPVPPGAVLCGIDDDGKTGRRVAWCDVAR